MSPGDSVLLTSGVYAYQMWTRPRNEAKFMASGTEAIVIRVVDSNTVIVAFDGGRHAPSNPNGLKRKY